MRKRLKPQLSKPTPTFRAVGSLAAMVGDIPDPQTAMMRTMGLPREADKRTLDEYIAEVDAGPSCSKRAPDVVLLGTSPRDTGSLPWRSPTRRAGSSPMSKSRWSSRVAMSPGLRKRRRSWSYSQVPVPTGQRIPAAPLYGHVGIGGSFRGATSDGSLGPPLRRTWAEVAEGSVRIRFHVGDLRQHGTDTSADVFILVRARPDDGILHGTWTATIRDQEGVAQGALDVALRDEPLDMATLIEVDAQ